MSAQIECPVLATRRRKLEIDVFRQFGYAIPEIVERDSKEGKELASSDRCVYLYSKNDRRPTDYGSDTSIVLSAYLSRGPSPRLDYAERSYRVALSDHADFNGCLDYVKATKAKFVLVDTRGGRAMELAQEVSQRLAITAIAYDAIPSREWGV
jgi:hypothetical protein